ncbi:hypothetical protein NIES4075_24910 [Tolypothrix sp. NIES-4075]|nr:hypothetical protein NIES4075_24910 [Tolypothrix sp. NIES-4075]
MAASKKVIIFNGLRQDSPTLSVASLSLVWRSATGGRLDWGRLNSFLLYETLREQNKGVGLNPPTRILYPQSLIPSP